MRIIDRYSFAGAEESDSKRATPRELARGGISNSCTIDGESCRVKKSRERRKDW